MTMFLTRQRLYRVIQRELPRDVYPDAGDPSLYWSTAESDANAYVLAQAYARLNQVWDNIWPQHADAEGISKHELLRFGYLSEGLTLEARQDRVVARVRSLPSLSVPDLEAIVRAELPEGTTVQIVKWGAGGQAGGTWSIGVSQLGDGTILGGYGAFLYPFGTDLCQQDGSEVGMSPTQWTNYRTNAYTFEVRIYEHNATAAELAAIERELTAAEWSAAGHFVTNNLSLDDYVGPYLPAMEP